MSKIGVVFVLAMALTCSAAIIVCEEEVPINEAKTRFLVQYIVEGDIIMIDECECSPAHQCDEKNSIELIKYKCKGSYSVCCVRPINRTNEIEST